MRFDFRAPFAVCALALSAATSVGTAEPLLTKGGGVLVSKFCARYACTSLGTLDLGGGTSRAYRLGKVPGVGVLSRVSGGRVSAMTLLLLDPSKQKDDALLRAIGQVLPDFQQLSLGGRHRFGVSKQCLRSSTVAKRVKVGGQSFSFTCLYDSPRLRAAVLRPYRLPPGAGIISVTYARP